MRRLTPADWQSLARLLLTLTLATLLLRFALLTFAQIDLPVTDAWLLCGFILLIMRLTTKHLRLKALAAKQDAHTPADPG